MRCKKHLTDHSSSVGVCGSCLRERLFALIAAQAQVQAQARVQQFHQEQEDRRKSDSHPPPLVFPRSVSPYICRRESRTTAHHHHSLSDQLFYSTPQIGPTAGTVTGNLNKKQKKRFSLFASLFRSKTKKTDLDPSVSDSNSRNSYTASSSSPSWFSSMLAGNQKKQSRLFSLDESTAGFGRRTGRIRDRGMSPARVSDYGDEEECYDGSSGYSSESSQGWRQTPRRAVPPVRRGGGRLSHSRNMSGLTFCLSPLVRASPNRHWNQKGMPPEIAFSGEIRAPVKPHMPRAASLCKNRSRKLADFGRFNHNR